MSTLTRRHLLAAAACLGLAAGGLASQASAAEMVDEIHFLIPGGAGGGWDGTARGTGEALTARAAAAARRSAIWWKMPRATTAP
jgi:putative tricarboxylic transport membrane protein